MDGARPAQRFAQIGGSLPTWLWPAIGVIAAVGFALRYAAAGGGLWLDEAWSSVFARDVATPIGVFANINHDNNHHLNTLWLQVVGFDAPPRLQRALSIASGTLTISVAAWFASRRGTAQALVTAALFALSPILVTYGSEARGYAPMLLALMVTVDMVDRWLSDQTRQEPALLLTVAALLGMLSQMTMAVGLAAVSGWVALTLTEREGWRRAARHTLALLGPALAVAVGTAVAIVLLLPGPKGVAFGQYQPFATADLAIGLEQLTDYTLGNALLIVVLAALAILGVKRPDPARPFYLLAIVGIPLAALLLRPGNVGAARYYLPTAAALLLLSGTSIGDALRRDRWSRMLGVAALAFIGIASLTHDAALIANQRADPAAVIATMAQRSPGGATVALDRPRASAVIEAAAAAARYPVREARCARFLFVDRDGDQPFPPAPRRCGMAYRPIAAADPTGLSGTHWRLYEAAAAP